MSIAECLRAHVVNEERFARFNELDSSRMDYTLQLLLPSGNVITLRNPSEAEDGTLIDKQHTVPPGAKLMAAGTAFWDWVAKEQHTVGIDIDAVDNHAAGLKAEEFGAALEAVRRVPWLEARRSSGGKGLHVFPRFKNPVPVSTRAEASALAAAVLTLASRQAEFDFRAVKDCAGGNMWIYKSDAADNAYEVIKEAIEALEPELLPPGWREAKSASKRKVQFAPSTTKLSPEHLAIEKQLHALGYSLIYVKELGCYHVHTCALQEAHKKHGYRGHFATVSQGTDPGEPNAYMFPLAEGAFLVKRFGNAMEDSSWFDSPGGKYAILNANVPFEKAVEHFSTNMTSKGFAYSRSGLEVMLQSIGTELEIPSGFEGRALFLKSSKSTGLIAVEKLDADRPIEGWTSTGKTWQRSFAVPSVAQAFSEAEVVRFSGGIRAVSKDTESEKWCIETDGTWVGTSSSEVRNVLAAHGAKDVSATMGRMREAPYWLVYEPFCKEYLPDRRWNRDAPQLACQPATEAGETPTWDAIFNHLGSGFDDDVQADEACQSRGITSGAQYLMLWVKLLIEKPSQRTPYLFLTSRQNNTGKTSLGASLHHLINPGVGEINEEALVDKFTSELEGKVLCLIEELDLRDQRKKAYSMLKRVLTSKTLTIRKMRTDAYSVPNFTHYIHSSNDANFVPCESEDMRIVMINVPPITSFIDTLIFEAGVKHEAPSMLRKLLDLTLPEPCGRFWLPVVQTSLKESVLTGLYETEVTEAEEGLKSFADRYLNKGIDEVIPMSEAFGRYVQYCLTEGITPVQKPGFLKTLRDKCGYTVDKKQMRVNGKQVWHYKGFSLRA